MFALQLGPIALPLAPLLWAAALWTAHAWASWLAGRGAGDDAPARAAGRAVWLSALLGLVAARVAFVAGAHEAYLAAPLLIFDLRDGGWSPTVGVAVALAAAAWSGFRQPPLRRPLASGFAAGTVLWLALAGLFGLHERPALPPLRLAQLQGGPVDLPSAAEGRPTVINLWASWCGPCRAEMPLLASAQQRTPGVRFLFVNQGEPAAVVHNYLAQHRIVLSNVLLDERSQLGPLVGSSGLPSTLFYDERGRLVARHMGVLSSASLAARLAEVQAK